MGNSLDFVISSSFFFFFFFFFFMLSTLELGASHDDCKVSRCGKHGPDVRFPFWLRDHQPAYCGYRGFNLSCTEKDDTVLELSSSVKLFVEKIDYKHQAIYVYDRNRCLLKQILHGLNFSFSPYQYMPYYYRFEPYSAPMTEFHMLNLTFLKCPPELPNLVYPELIPISCLNFPDYQVYFVCYSYDISWFSSYSCTKIKTIEFSAYLLWNDLPLHWSKPQCDYCEAAGKRCKLKNNTETETECKPSHKRIGSTHKLIIAGASVGLFLLVLVAIGVFSVWTTDKTEKENQVKIEKFLEDYKALKPTRYSYADIKRITNQFKDKLGQGGHGTVFKGNLSSEIFVAVKILDNSDGNGEDFINEVGTMGRIHHVNVVRLVGFCADGFKRAIVYEFLPNSLEKVIFTSSGKANSLGWEKLQDIALGIAKGIEYLHQGCDQRILHFDIKPHNILLDHNLIPKISDFGLAKLCSKEQSIVSMTTARGTMGYIAPEVFSRNFGSVSYKSDVYSFGMMLLEMVGGRKNTDTAIQHNSQVYFPEWIYNRLNHGEELGIQIEEEQDSNIARKLTIVGLRCIQWYPVDRPSMKVVVQMLEGDGESLTIPPNPFASTNSMMTSAITHKRPLNKELEVISEIE